MLLVVKGTNGMQGAPCCQKYIWILDTFPWKSYQYVKNFRLARKRNFRPLVEPKFYYRVYKHTLTDSILRQINPLTSFHALCLTL